MLLRGNQHQVILAIFPTPNQPDLGIESFHEAIKLERVFNSCPPDMADKRAGPQPCLPGRRVELDMSDGDATKWIQQMTRLPEKPWWHGRGIIHLDTAPARIRLVTEGRASKF
jgi:hypothetical protein